MYRSGQNFPVAKQSATSHVNRDEHSSTLFLKTSNIWSQSISCLHAIRTCFSVTCPHKNGERGKVGANCPVI